MKIRTAIESLFPSRHATISGFFLVTIRIAIGIQFFWTGISKLIHGWTAQGYLESATGPFASWFQGMADSHIISMLNVWGLTAIGLALILGLLVRPASFFGALLMALYYFAHFTQNTANGFVEFHVIYALFFVLMLCGGFGHAFGLDGMIFDGTRGKKWWRFTFFG